MFKYLNNILSYQAVSLRTILIVPFVVLLLVSVGLTGYLSLRNGQQAVNDVASQLRREITAAIEQNIDNYLETPHLITQSNADAIELGLLDLKEPTTLERHFWQQLQRFDTVSNIYVGNQQGGIVLAGRGEEGSLNIRATEGFVSGDYYIYDTDEAGKRTELLRVAPPYDARIRPWYEASKKAGVPVWSEIYAFFTDQTLGISASRPLYDKNGALEGVLAIDLSLAQLSDFLQSLKIGQTGRTFIMERSGFIVASSASEPPFVQAEDEQEPERLKAVDSQNLLIQATAQYLIQEFGDLNNIVTIQELSFEIDGQQQFLQITPLVDKRGIDWLIVVVMPESDFMGQINKNAKTTLITLTIALIIAILVGLFIVQQAVQPITQLNIAAKGLAEGEWKQSLPTTGAYEVGQLAHSFSSMVEQMKVSLTRLEAKNWQLHENENQLRQFLEAMPVAVVILEANGTLFYTNQLAKEIFGDTQSIDPVLAIDARAINFPRYIAGTDETYPYDHLPTVRALQGETVTVDDIEILYNNKRIPLEIWSTPIFDETGQIRYAIVAFQDITTRREAEKHLTEYRVHLESMVEQRTAELAHVNELLQNDIIKRKEAEEAAKAASQAKSIFLANMSHELRTPLNTILGFAQLMTRSQGLTPSQQENLDVISRSGEHLLTLISNILNLSKIEAGRVMLHKQNCDLYRMLNDLVDMFQLWADKKRLQLLYERAPDLPRYVYLDEVKLRQVLINLLNNAIKFTPLGYVALNVSYSLSKSDILQKNITYLSLTFEVKDSGVGITPDERADLFEAFIQTKAGLQLQEGSGLGLPISRQFVQLMGGDISVESPAIKIDSATSTNSKHSYGPGTIFRFDIHAGLVSATEIPTQEAWQWVIGLEPNQPQYRILVVDDMLENRQLLVKLLKPIGFMVQTAANGQETLDIWERWQPDLIWMDMRMPIMDGFEVTKRLKAMAKGQETIIIALTAGVLEEERAAVLAAGCDDFMRKPFREADIFTIMQKYLGVRYIYEAVPNINPVPTSEILADLTLLSPDWLADFHHAAVRANGQTILNLITQIESDYPALALSLQGLVDNFQFDKLSTLVDQNIDKASEL